jgi:hypothetical protein
MEGGSRDLIRSIIPAFASRKFPVRTVDLLADI